MPTIYHLGEDQKEVKRIKLNDCPVTQVYVTIGPENDKGLLMLVNERGEGIGLIVALSSKSMPPT